MIDLQYDDFDFVAGFIHIPANVLWYRAARPEVRDLGEESIYVAPKYVADSYARNPIRVPCMYSNPRPLRVLDWRFVQQIIPYILSNRPQNPINEGAMMWYKHMCITFGACSLRRQIELLKEFCEANTRASGFRVIQNGIANMELFLNRGYVHEPRFPNTDFSINPVEKGGVRVSLLEMDHAVIRILRTVFSQADGIISPALSTPFHGQESFSPELVVFHPNKTLVETPLSTVAAETVSLQDIVHQAYGTEGYAMGVDLGYRMAAPQEREGGKKETLQSRSVITVDRELILSKMRKGVKTVLRKMESAERFAKSIDLEKLPRFLWEYTIGHKPGRMWGLLDWNVIQASTLSRKHSNANKETYAN